MTTRILLSAMILIGSVTCMNAQEQASLAPYIELLRSDVRTEKIAIITENMNLTEEESAAFWPIYRQYDVELSALTDEWIALIKDYGAHYENLTAEKARELVKRTLDLQEKRIKLKRKYYNQLEKALSAKNAAKFVQLENQIEKLIDVQVAAAIPLIK